MLILFRLQIRSLIQARDAAVEAWVGDHPGENVYEARSLEVTSELSIDVEGQIETVRRVLAERGGNGG
jgi:hypothetical protein